MPIKIEYKSEKDVRDIPMTGLVSYSDVIDETYRLIKEKGLVLAESSFRPNANGDTVTATFIIHPTEKSQDEDLDLCITWSHSYHKAIRFNCNVSAIDHEGNIMIRNTSISNLKARRASDPEKYKLEIFDDLKLEVQFCETGFKSIVEVKDIFKDSKADIEIASSILGMLYVQEDILTTSQASVIKDNILTKEIDSAYNIYKCFAEGLKDSHPKLFITDHIDVFGLFEDLFTPVVLEIPKQSLSLPVNNDNKVDKEILEDYNYVSNMPSIVFL